MEEGGDHLEASSLCLWPLGLDDVKVGLSQDCGWEAHTWPLHVAWTFHSTEVEFQEGESLRVSREQVSPGLPGKLCGSF